MTWGARIRLTVGVIFVLALVAALTLVFTQRQSSADSTAATIMAEEYPVGTDFGGTITSEWVKVGQKVQAGQAMFAVESKTLQNEIATHQLRGVAAQGIGANGQTVVTAPVAGTVQDLSYSQGAYAPAGTVLTSVDKAGSLFVSASFTVAPLDYARIRQGAQVDIVMPDHTSYTGTVGEITVTTPGSQGQAGSPASGSSQPPTSSQAQTTLKITVPGLVQGADGGLVTPGTPVQATVHLKNQGILAGPFDALSGLARQIGI